MLYPKIILIVFISFISSFISAQCSFSVSDATPCVGESVIFEVDDPTGAPSNYAWDFDNDNMPDASGFSASFSFSTSGSFSINLSQNGMQCASNFINVLSSPDVSIGVPAGALVLNGNTIRTCNGSSEATVQIYNASSTIGTNASYEIDWGEGNIESYTNATFNQNTLISHTYSGFGYHNFAITTTGNNGCTTTSNYQFYNGGNPSVGLGNPGNTVGICAPETLSFPITSVNNNPPGTVYTISINGEEVQTYNQSNIPSTFDYTFTQSSCDLETSTGNYEHAFDVEIVAENPCGSSTATVEPIEVTTPPIPQIGVDYPANSCPEEIFTFSNNSIGIGEVISGNPTICEDELDATWEISPGMIGVDWDIISGSIFGSNEIEVAFNFPGSYTVTMTVVSQACGPQTISETINVLEPPTAAAIALSQGNDNCIPTIVNFDNQSEGFDISFNWEISPSEGWEFVNNTTPSSEHPSVNFTSAGTYDIMLTTSNICDFDTWDTTLVFITTPTIILDSIETACNSANLSFSDLNVSYQDNGNAITGYLWEFPGGIPASSTDPYPSNIQYNSPGTYTVTATAINECGPAAASQSFTIQEPVELILSEDMEVCIDELPFQLTANVEGGTWSGQGVDEEGIFTPEDAGEGIHEITYSYGNGICASIATLEITVLPLPNVEILLPPTEVCVSELYVDLSASPSGGDWLVNNDGVITNNQFLPSQSGAGDYMVVYVFTDIYGCTNTDTIRIEVHPLPQIVVSDTTYCNTIGIVDLPYAQPTGGTWSGTGVVNSSGTFDPQAINPAPSVELEYTYTDENNCTNSEIITVTITDPENVSAGLDTSFCVSVTAFDLSTISSPEGGAWSSTSDGLDGIVFNPQEAGVGTHTLTYTVGTGNCQVEDELIIEVYSLPIIDISANVQESCISVESVGLSASPSGGTWSSPDGGSIIGNQFFPISSGEGNFTLLYEYIDINGCSDSESLTFEVFGLPQIFVNDTIYCNTPGLVDLPFAQPQGGSWSGTGVINPTGTFDPQSAPIDTPITLTYSFTDENGCSNSDSIIVTVINPENVSAGLDTSFCVSVTAFDLSTISSPEGGIWSSASDGLEGVVFNPQEAGVGTHTLTYTVGAGNCQVSDELDIEVLALPVIEIDNNPNSACVSGDDITLVALPMGGVWSSPNGGNIDGSTFSPSLSGEGNYLLEYEFIDENLCANSDSINFSVNPLPTITVGDTTYCNTPGAVSLPFATPIGGSWSGPGVVDVSSMFEPEIAGGTGNYSLTYIFSDNNGCADSTTINVEVIDPVDIHAGNDTIVCIDQGLYQIPNFLPQSGGTWSGTGIINPQDGIFDPEIAGGGVHTLTYTFGNGNCQVQDAIQIEVIDVVSGISAGLDEEVCLLDEAFMLTGNMPADGTWTGNGITNATLGIFDPSVAGEGTHIITYAFEDSYSGCSASATKEIVVHPMPESAFSLPDEACLNQLIQFTNLSQDSTQVSWNFGDGGTSNLPSPEHTYTQTGTYNVTLVTTTQYGCEDSITQTLFITEPPSPSFSLNTNEGCAVLDVIFDNQSTGYDMSYLWDFGNGETSTEMQPNTISYEQGTSDTLYFPSLTVSNLCAAITLTDTVTVFPLPQVNFSPNIDTSCTPMTVSFSNVTLGNPETFFWDYGNGNTSMDSTPITQVYETDTLPTIYTVTLSSSNTCGSDTASYDIVVNPSNVTAFFNIPDSVGCQPFTVPFSNFSSTDADVYYDFGDGNTSDQNNPTHTFSEAGEYTIIQYATYGCGYDSTIAQITVLPAPEISFIAEPTACINQAIQFFNTTDNISGIYWDFGDGTTSTLHDPYHTFTEPGIYTVTLTGVSTLNGCEASNSNTIEVLGLPLASFEPSDIDGCIPHSIDFTNNSVGANYYDWDFGDGNTSNLENPSHTYADTGQFTVTLVIRDENGCFGDTSMFNIFVFPVPAVDFEFQMEETCGIPLEVTFSNLTPEGTVNGFNWSLGDGQTSTYTNPSHTYETAGDYTVSLVASNQYNCTDTVQQSLTAYEIPSAIVEIEDNEGCEDFTVDFGNASLDANTYYWTFGDGATSTEENPSYTYSEAGIYNAGLIVSMDDVCFDTLPYPIQINVLPSPFANFEAIEIEKTPNSAQFEFENLSIDAYTYFWDFGDGTTSTEEHPSHRYYSNGPMQVYLEATSFNDCVDDTLLTIIPDFIKGLFIPNAFMPNNGIGDVAVFQPKGVGLKEYEIEIFSTYGERIWYSNKLIDGQPSEAWDGTFKGQELPSDVYVWKVKKAIFDDGSSWRGMKVEGSGFKTMGSVTLIR